MRKFIFFALLSLLFLPFMSACGGGDDDDDSDNGKQQTEANIVSVWKETPNNQESVLSFAKDGTYKIILYVSKNNYFISTGTYSFANGKLACVDNCVDAASKTYDVSISSDDQLEFEGKTFKRIGLEQNAFTNKLSGRNQVYGGYTMSSHYETAGETNYYLQFTNDYTAYEVIETIYYKDASKNRTKRTLKHYIYYDGYMYLADENSSCSPKYTVDFNEYNCFYYTDDEGQIHLP